MFDMPNAQPPDPRVEALFEKLKDRTEEVGLYMQTAAVIQDEEDPTAQPVLAAMFMIGDRAYDPTATDPDEMERDKEWRKISASEVDLIRQQLIEELGEDADDEQE